MKIHLIVSDFSSHRTWAAGYQRATAEHDVQLTTVSADRWKWRMLTGAIDEVEPHVTSLMAADVILVDGGMLDARPLIQLLSKHNVRNNDATTTTSRRPTILLYMHENQLTTPFTQQDRDVVHQTHWHYGMIHFMSILAVDGVVFNSTTHQQAFCEALLRLIKEQCPVDSRSWYLERAQEAINNKFTKLYYGLDLDRLLLQTPTLPFNENHHQETLPVILWNARLEADKDPETFVEILQATRPNKFRLIVLGSDPTKEQSWYQRLQAEFGDELWHIGWCNDRTDYATWLHRADIVLSTAKHETFGISIVESVYCGALPLLPQRLSYPELFCTTTFAPHFYQSTSHAVHQLSQLLQLFATNPTQWAAAVSRCQQAVARFRWQEMGPLYDEFFARVARQGSLEGLHDKPTNEEQKLKRDDTTRASTTTDLIPITDANDARVQLYRPKSVRHSIDYHRQLRELRKEGIEPVLHGGRRATVRMLEAIGMGAKIKPLSFLTTNELAKGVLGPLQRKHAPEIPLYVSEKETLDTIRGQKLNSGDAILAMIQFPIPVDLSELLDNPPLLILEDVRNAENIGSILRTAFCLGITSVVASRTAWAALRDSRSARCSMGTMYYHRFFSAHDSLQETIELIRKAGIRVYGIEIGPEARPITPHGNRRNWAMVLGNEDAGMTHETRQVCHDIVFVPQAHGDSLNVGHAAAISLFELGRECPLPEHDGRAACS